MTIIRRFESAHLMLSAPLISMLISNVHPTWISLARPVNWQDGIGVGWLPVEFGGSPPVVRWIETGLSQLSEPFFKDSIKYCRFRDCAELETDFSIFKTGTAHLLPVQPAGIIFHMSRCGSTLLMNGLKVADDVVGLSEAAAMDLMISMAAAPNYLWARTGAALLTPLATVFAHYQGLPPRRVIIKCGFGSILHLRAIRAVWPNVPCIVLIRNPIEVIVSNVRKRAEWLTLFHDDPDKCVFGRPPEDVICARKGEFCAWVIGRFCAEALKALDDGCRVIDYANLTVDTIFAVASYFGLQFSHEGKKRLNEVMTVDSKRPANTFEDDSERKRSSATPVMINGASRWVDSLYQQLLALSAGNRGADGMACIAGED